MIKQLNDNQNKGVDPEPEQDQQNVTIQLQFTTEYQKNCGWVDDSPQCPSKFKSPESPSQEFKSPESPSQEFYSPESPSQEFKSPESPSQEFYSPESPSQESQNQQQIFDRLNFNLSPKYQDQGLSFTHPSTQSFSQESKSILSVSDFLLDQNHPQNEINKLKNQISKHDQVDQNFQPIHQGPNSNKDKHHKAPIFKKNKEISSLVPLFESKKRSYLHIQLNKQAQDSNQKIKQGKPEQTKQLLRYEIKELINQFEKSSQQNSQILKTREYIQFKSKSTKQQGFKLFQNLYGVQTLKDDVIKISDKSDKIRKVSQKFHKSPEYIKSILNGQMDYNNKLAHLKYIHTFENSVIEPENFYFFQKLKQDQKKDERKDETKDQKKDQ